MEKIAISPSYLAAAKQQAYSVRDKIRNSLFVEVYYSKSEFLDLWASGLGYANWGELNAITLNANTGCTSTLVLTPASAQYLAERIISNSHNPNADYHAILFIILELMSDEERKNYPDVLFNAATANYKSIQETPINLLVGYSGYTKVLADYLINDGYTLHIPYDMFADTLLGHAKKLRKKLQLSKKEASLHHLDIYPKSGTSPDQILEAAIKKGLIEINTDYSRENPVQYIELTEEALQYYALEFTGDYSKEWIQWKRKFDKEWTTSDRQKTPFSNFQLMWQYRNEMTPQESVEAHSQPADSYEVPPVTGKNFETTNRRGFNLDVTESNWSSVVMAQTNEDIVESCFFYFMPRLYLPRLPNKLKDINLISFTAISDTGEALAIPELEARKPLPNTDWIVAGAKEHTKIGFYCAIPIETKTITSNTKWEVNLKGKTYLIDHTITINLVYVPGNRFFSSERISDFNANNPLGLLPSNCFGVHSVLGGQQIIGCAKNKEEYATIPRVANPNFFCELKDCVFTLRDEVTIGSSIPVKTSYEIGY